MQQVIDSWHDAYKTRYSATQIGAEINKVQKEIGQLKKAKKDEEAKNLLQKKADLEAEKKRREDEATQKEKERDKKCKTIGNYVHESVRVSDNEDDNDVVQRWAPRRYAAARRRAEGGRYTLTS